MKTTTKSNLHPSPSKNRANSPQTPSTLNNLNTGCYSRINFGKEGGIPSGESAKYFGGVKKNALARKMVGIAKGRTFQLASLNCSLQTGSGNVVVLGTGENVRGGRPLLY